MNLTLLLFSFFALSSHASIGTFKPWESSSNPAIMSKTFEKKFSSLPLAGQVSETKKYWSSDYWPLFKGNINFRWNSTNPIGFNLVSPSKEEALRMTSQELAQLAPSEKYDLYTGKYTYPLRNQVKKRVSPRRKEWEGICHGWAAAALNHNEPEPKVLTNPDGIKIPFGSSDIKALISYYYAYHYDPVTTHQMGRRCNGTRFCADDMNAGAFHIVLTNKMGLEKKSFITDIENGREVWNQVASQYKTEVIDANLSPVSSSAKGTVKVIRVKTIVRYVLNIVKNSWLPSNGTSMATFKDYLYEYDLDIDKNGQIIGGDWRSKVRPDFLWLVKPATQFGGPFIKLRRLLNDKRGVWP